MTKVIFAVIKSASLYPAMQRELDSGKRHGRGEKEFGVIVILRKAKDL